jgi:hypothetical protein
VAILGEFCAGHAINVLVGSRGRLPVPVHWVADLLKRAGHPACGALLSLNVLSDRAASDVKPIVPLVKAACANSFEFDTQGREKTVDYPRVTGVLLDAGYRGYVGIAYRGRQLDEYEGIRATKTLLESVADTRPLPS